MPVLQHTWPVPGHVGPGWQTPLWQVSFTVHALPSLHAVPLGLFSTPQTPPLHVARRH
jgi:hypothetical protein